MKRGGISNAYLAGALAWLGHTHTVVVCDARLPQPDTPRKTLDIEEGTNIVGRVVREVSDALKNTLNGYLDEQN